MRKQLIAGLMILMILVLCACGEAGSGNGAGVPAAGTENVDTGASGPQYSFPKSYAWFLGKTDYAPLGSSTEAVPSGEFPMPEEFADAAVVQGNRIIITASDEKRDALINQNDLLLSQALDAWMNLNPEYTFENDDDYSSMTFGMDESYSRIDVDHQIEETNLMLTILYMIHANHILKSGDSNISTDVRLDNYHSGKKAAEFSYPAQTLNFASIDWTETY